MIIKKIFIVFYFSLILSYPSSSQQPTSINLNGTWEFDQTINAFPPKIFTRKIPVPGLIHLAIPRIDEYNKFFQKPDKVKTKTDHSVFDIDYTPRYNWYRKRIFIPEKVQGLEGILSIKKSQYVTQVYINGIDLGNFIECFTPIDVAITRALKYNQENEIIIKTGDRYWLPSAAAGGTDKEKEHYLPGIWDDVTLSFSNKLKVHRVLILPQLNNEKITAKVKLWNLNAAQQFYGDPMKDSLLLKIKVYEKISKKTVAEYEQKNTAIRDRNTEVSVEIPLKNIHAWSPEDPFLYTAEISVFYKEKLSDKIEKNFGMRDFERRGKFFFLNNKKIILRGTNITLQRFFEDPDCSNLAWDKEWVKKMLITLPKQLDWNAIRICVGIVPDFWYDLADEYGMLFQNEWLYWQNHGQNDQIKKEYTDWVWADGSHPSIAIWDAINENYDAYIGNTLIPELIKLDPTRIWDAGYMTSSEMGNDEMDEPHPYFGMAFLYDSSNKEIYPLGNLDFKPPIIKQAEESKSAQLINEYGWVWLWRNGTPSKLTLPIYEKYLGKNSSVDERRNFQAYWLQLETEWLRSNSYFAGILAFCYLTNNYGYTGDWFTGNIKDLNTGPVLKWFKECFALTNVFINLTDERYIMQAPHKPGENLSLTFVGINDKVQGSSGITEILLYNSKGKIVYSNKIKTTIPAYGRIKIPFTFKIPDVADGYLLQTFFSENGSIEKRVSRRYIKVGSKTHYDYYDLQAP